MKQEISLQKCMYMITSGPVVLLTSSLREEATIMAASWNMPFSRKPPLVGVYVGSSSYSWSLIRESGEFVINIPHSGLLKEIIYCGTVSGRHFNKFENTSLTPEPGVRVKTPCLRECIGHLECRVSDIYNRKNASVFIGEVLRAVVEEDFFINDHWNTDRIRLVHHLGEQCYEISGEMVTMPPASDKQL